MKATATKPATTRQPATKAATAKSSATRPAAKDKTATAAARKPEVARPAVVKKTVAKPLKAAAKEVPAKKAAPVAAGSRKATKASETVTAVPDKKAVSPVKSSSKPASSPAKASKPAVSSTPAPKPERMAKNATVTPPAAPVLPVVPRVSAKAAAKAAALAVAPVAAVPTHAPDAAKATFTPISERVMTPSVTMPLQKDPKRANNWKSVPLDQLTDADVLAMPDGEYMNDVQLAFFRRKLQLLKADMLANAGETTEHLREDTVVVPDPADRATIEEEHALELRTRDRERKLLKKIEQAIARIDSGDYGYCEETGEPIGVGRLMARPTASLSLEAQQRRELKQKMFGD